MNHCVVDCRGRLCIHLVRQLDGLNLLSPWRKRWNCIKSLHVGPRLDLSATYHSKLNVSTSKTLATLLLEIRQHKTVARMSRFPTPASLLWVVLNAPHDVLIIPTGISRSRCSCSPKWYATPENVFTVSVVQGNHLCGTSSNGFAATTVSI